jgi:ATP-dependent phosphoenolpyruvate carboxykinase
MLCWPQSRIKVRVVCARAYHALFMHNMLIRPNDKELAEFGHPDFTIFNAGAFPVNRYTSYMSSSTSVDVNLRCCSFLGAACPCLQSFHAFNVLHAQQRSLHAAAQAEMHATAG